VQTNNARLWKELELGQAELEQLDAELFARVGAIQNAFNSAADALPSISTDAVEIPSSAQWAGGGGQQVPPFIKQWYGASHIKPRKENPVVVAMVEVLRDAGRPLKPGEIYDALVDRAVPIPGKSPRNNLSAYLHNGTPAIFMKTSDGLWTVREKEAA
jgi:hypothetical protein